MDILDRFNFRSRVHPMNVYSVILEIAKQDKSHTYGMLMGKVHKFTETIQVLKKQTPKMM